MLSFAIKKKKWQENSHALICSFAWKQIWCKNLTKANKGKIQMVLFLLLERNSDNLLHFPVVFDCQAQIPQIPFLLLLHTNHSIYWTCLRVLSIFQVHLLLWVCFKDTQYIQWSYIICVRVKNIVEMIEITVLVFWFKILHCFGRIVIDTFSRILHERK